MSTVRKYVMQFLGFCDTSDGLERVSLMKEKPRSLLRYQILQLKWYSRKLALAFSRNLRGFGRR